MTFSIIKGKFLSNDLNLEQIGTNILEKTDVEYSLNNLYDIIQIANIFLLKQRVRKDPEYDHIIESIKNINRYKNKTIIARDKAPGANLKADSDDNHIIVINYYIDKEFYSMIYWKDEIDKKHRVIFDLINNKEIILQKYALWKVIL